MSANRRGTLTVLRQPLTLFLLAWLLGAAIYAPGISGPFLFDDWSNIHLNSKLDLASVDAASLQRVLDAAPQGGGSRPLSFLSFAANRNAGGGAAAMKAVNVGLHLLIGVAVLVLLQRLLPQLLPPGTDHRQIRWLAVFAAGAWLLHPLHVSTVLYTVQRMTQLSALCVLAGCVVWVGWRSRQLAGEPVSPLRAPLGVAALGAIGYLCKENAALLPVLLLVIEGVAFRCRAPASAPVWFRPALLAYLLLPATVIGAYLIHRGLGWDAPLVNRDFTVAERLLTQPRILGHYLAWIAWPNPAQLSFYHDTLAISRGVGQPATTLPALLAWAAALAAAGWALWTRRWPVPAFGLLWFVGAQLIESTSLPLELVFEHRNYLPSLGPILVIAWALGRLVNFLSQRIAPLVLVGALLVTPSALLAEHVAHWAARSSLMRHVLDSKPDSPRAWSSFGQYLLDRGELDQALLAMRRADALADGNANFVLAEIIVRCGIGDAIEPRIIDRAIAHLAAGKVFSPSGRLWQNIGHYCVRQPHYADSMHRLLSAAGRHPDAGLAASAWFLNSIVLEGQGRDAEALAAARRALVLDPGAEALVERVEVLREAAR